jgi:hypothetical protein
MAVVTEDSRWRLRGSILPVDLLAMADALDDCATLEFRRATR